MLLEATASNLETADPSATLEAAELEVAVSQAIQRLPPRRREIFELARFHGRRYHEIAVIAGISVQTVANQMSAAITQLRRSLSRFETAAPRGAREVP
jgi:RNA polymerase sigma-70 factor (ECF subfamily)